MNATATMERAPRSGNDVVMTITYHRRDGTEKVDKITRKQAWILAGIVMALLMWFSTGADALSSWAKRQDSDAQRPMMEKLANEGKDYAALWLVQHYSAESVTRLPALVDKGYPEAMLYQGVLKTREGDKEGGWKMIEDAAAKGYSPAIQYIESNKK